jgi:hypothetical protein
VANPCGFATHFRKCIPYDPRRKSLKGADRLSGIDVARVTKKLVARTGLDPAKYAGHSLQAGHATTAAIAAASEWSIMKHRAPVGSDGKAVHQRWELVPGEQRGQAWVVIMTRAVKSHGPSISSIHIFFSFSQTSSIRFSVCSASRCAFLLTHLNNRFRSVSRT